MKQELLLWYHEPSDQLAIGAKDWEYVVLVKFVPFTRHRCDRLEDTGLDDQPIEYVEHPIAQEITSDWCVIGEF